MKKPERAADKIRRGLEQAIAIARGEADLSTYRIHHVMVPPRIDVRAIRNRLGMSQQGFADEFQFNVETVRNWEQGKRRPRKAMRCYLIVIDRAPKAVRKALKAA